MENATSKPVPEWLKGSSATPSTVAVSTPVEPTPPVLSSPPNAFALHKLGLLVTCVQEDKTKPFDIKVEFTGKWDGKFIKAACKAVEKEYKRLQHNQVRTTIKQKVAALITKE